MVWDCSSNWEERLLCTERVASSSLASSTWGPVVVQTGTVDGDTTWGWGNPESDFYAMSQLETEEALERLSAAFDRIWVYRIYDTVTDPSGFIRRRLAEYGTQFEDRVFTGESQLRVQGFLTGRDPLDAAEPTLDASLADASMRLVSVRTVPQQHIRALHRVRQELAGRRPARAKQVWGLALNAGHAVRPFHMQADSGWALDLADLDSQVTASTRIIAVCNPNNPTGYITTDAEMDAVVPGAGSVESTSATDAAMNDSNAHALNS